MKYTFLALTYLCSLNITEEKHDLERLLYLCYLNNNSYTKLIVNLRVSKNQKGIIAMWV